MIPQVWVSVSKRRKKELGMAYSGTEYQPVTDLNRDDWELVRYVLPPTPEQLQMLQDIVDCTLYYITDVERNDLDQLLQRMRNE